MYPGVSPGAPALRGNRDRQRSDAGGEATNAGRDALTAHSETESAAGDMLVG
jgi:hypothetical protein